MAALLGGTRASSVARSVGSSLGVFMTRLHGFSIHSFGMGKDEANLQTRFGLVHPTAVIHPGAVIGQGVSIGPFCSIGSSAKLGDGCQMHAGSHIFGTSELGENCILLPLDFASPWLNLKLSGSGAIVGADLPGHTIIGRGNVIGHHALIGVKCQDMKHKTGDECFLDIGDNNEIREYTSIHLSSNSSDKTVIGDNNLIMGSCHIAHDCKIGSKNIFANNTLLAGHVVVEDYVHTAGAAVVHQFCHLGSYCFIGGGSVISQDVPRYMMVSGERAELRGLNSEGLRRHGFSYSEVQNLYINIKLIQGMRRAYRQIFMPTEGSAETIENRLSKLVSKLDGTVTLMSTVVPLAVSFSVYAGTRSRTGENSCCVLHGEIHSRFSSIGSSWNMQIQELASS